MSITSEITRIKNNISSAYTALDGKGASLPLIQDSTNLANTIESIPAGGSAVVEQALNLYDWEGTLLKSYTAAEAQALAALPNPSDCPAYLGVDHELLLFQEWNWSLADIKTWIQDNEGKTCNADAIYTTTDGQDHNFWNSPRLDTANTISMQKRGTTSIGNNAFQDHFSLTQISIPNGVTSIGTSAFQVCSSLTQISIPNSVTSIGTSAFSYCRSLIQINISNSVTSIGASAFQGCSSLTQISIPNSVTSIGTSAFSYCRSLTQISIPNGVTSIGTSAFQVCSSLTQISIPNSVTSIGTSAFQDCNTLCDILNESKAALSNTNVFNGLPSIYRIYVPRANLSWFETETNWATIYTAHIVAIEDYIEYLESLGYNVDAYKNNININPNDGPIGSGGAD